MADPAAIRLYLAEQLVESLDDLIHAVIELQPDATRWLPDSLLKPSARLAALLDYPKPPLVERETFTNRFARVLELHNPHAEESSLRFVVYSYEMGDDPLGKGFENEQFGDFDVEVRQAVLAVLYRWQRAIDELLEGLGYSYVTERQIAKHEAKRAAEEEAWIASLTSEVPAPVSASTLARKLRCPTATVTRAIRAGRIKAREQDGGYLISHAECEKFRASRAAEEEILAKDTTAHRQRRIAAWLCKGCGESYPDQPERCAHCVSTTFDPVMAPRI